MLGDPDPGLSRLRGVFMHEIRPPGETVRQVSAETPTEKLHYFYHYGQAGEQALAAGLIDSAGYDKVLEAFAHESQQAADAKLGDPQAILGTFQALRKG